MTFYGIKKFAVLNFVILILSLAGCHQTGDVITIENDLLIVKISITGAELQSIHGKVSGWEYLWQGDPEHWDGQAPIMFPVNVRFKDEQLTYGGELYEMPRMGLAMYLEFSNVPLAENNRAALELASSEETLKFYPFPFRLNVSYILQDNILINRFEIENTGEKTMYFALGGHPGFNCPTDQGKDRKDYQYGFPTSLHIDRILIFESLLQPDTLPFLENESALNLADPRIPDAGMFLKNAPCRQISVGPAGGLPYVTVDLGDFPNINLWSPPGKPFACIEPMVAHHDLYDSPLAIEEKPHLIKLPAGQSRTYDFSIIMHLEE
jgi:galactose mutarotase-like enzyme